MTTIKNILTYEILHIEGYKFVAIKTAKGASAGAYYHFSVDFKNSEIYFNYGHKPRNMIVRKWIEENTKLLETYYNN